MSYARWQHIAHARRRLWYLVMERFAVPQRPFQITITRDDLLAARVIGHDFDASGRPNVFVGRPDREIRAGARGEEEK